MGKNFNLIKTNILKLYLIDFRLQLLMLLLMLLLFLFFFNNNFTKIRSIVLFLEEFQSLYLSWNWMK